MMSQFDSLFLFIPISGLIKYLTIFSYPFIHALNNGFVLFRFSIYIYISSIFYLTSPKK
ncbi:hypothetical protein U3516DRAFT_905412 [Neocallimastix sp. 'constans']